MSDDPQEYVAQGVTSSALQDAWRTRFFLIWGGQAISLIGSALTQFVLIWWITETTESAAALAVAGMAGLLPQALFGPIGGTLADRFSRRLLMIVADVVSALSMLLLIGLFATGAVELWHVYVLMFVRSTMQAFQSPAATASTSMLVPVEWLSRAAGMNQLMMAMMSLASAPLGALALSLLPLDQALWIDIITGLLGITPLFFFRIPQHRQPSATQNHFLSDLWGGIRFVGSHRGLLLIYIINSLVILVLMPTFSLAPLIVRTHFQGGVEQVAIMEFGAGVGMLLGGVAISFFAIRKRKILVAIIAFSISCLSIGLMGLAPSHLFWLAVFWWFVSGVATSMGNAPMMAILQTIIPNEFQGRAFSLLSTMTGIAGPLGLSLSAPIGELIGVRTLFIVCGFLSALVCLLALCSSSLRHLEDAPIEA